MERSQACREGYGRSMDSFPLVLRGGGGGRWEVGGGGASSKSPLLKTQTGSAHINAYRLSSVNVEHSSCPHLK